MEGACGRGAGLSGGAHGGRGAGLTGGAHGGRGISGSGEEVGTDNNGGGRLRGCAGHGRGRGNARGGTRGGRCSGGESDSEGSGDRTVRGSAGPGRGRGLVAGTGGGGRGRGSAGGGSGSAVDASSAAGVWEVLVLKHIGLSWAPKLPPLPTTKKDSGPNPSGAQESLWKPGSELVDGLFVPPRDPRKANKLARKNVKDTTGKGWFDMPAPSITPELKKDLEILQLRHVMDPKRHFKRAGKSKALPKYFQVGTVIEPASEFFSSRLTKKEQKTTLVDELLSDQSLRNYRMRKVREIQETQTPGGNQKWKNKGKKTFKKAKDRRK